MKQRRRILFLIIFSLSSLPACQSQPRYLEPPKPDFISQSAIGADLPEVKQPARPSTAKPPPAVRFEHLNVEDGLSHSEVWAIVQDQKGFLWFGTQNGLNKYDGYQFKTYRHDPLDKGSLRDNFIESLFIDSAGALWVGTQGGWLERYNPANDSFTHYHFTAHINDIIEDSEGKLWLGTATPGLVRFDPATGEAQTVWSAASVRSVDVDDQGNIWAASSESGIVQVSLAAEIREEYHPEYTIWDLAVSPDGRIWLATIKAGVGFLDPSNGEFHYNIVNPEVLQVEGNNSIRKIYFDSEGLLWIGHFQTSLLRYDPVLEEFTHFIPDLTDPTSVMANSVFTFYRDQAGILWVGYGIGGGISKLVVGADCFGHYRHILDDPNSLVANLVISIAGRGDILWLGTFSGLNRWNRTTGEWTHYSPNPTIQFSQLHSTIRSIFVDSQDTVWVGTEQGLERYDPINDGFIHLGGPVVMWMHEGPSGRFWLATKDGFYEYNRELERFDFIRSGFAWKIMVHEDHSGIVWVGTSGDGLERYDPSTNSWTIYTHDPDDPTSLSHNSVEAILEDSYGKIWVATGGGLNRLDQENGTFSHFTVADGLANDRITGLLEDEFGDLWLATDSGLSRFQPDLGIFENYTTRDGVQGPNFWRNSYYKSEEGELFFGGANGINAFFPENIVPNPRVPPVVITNLSLFNQPIQADLPPGEELTFTHDENFLSFDFVALDYTDPSQNQYAYQMAGLDTEWIEAGNRRHADYPDLRPGDYTFHVIASNNDGVWNEQGVWVHITIKHPFWESAWFISLMIIAVVGAGYGAYRYRVSNLRKRSLQLEEEVAVRTAELQSANLNLEQEISERERIEQILTEKAAEEAVAEERTRLARELHDAVTQTLFSASLLAEALPASLENDPEESRQLLKEIRQLSRGALAEMRTLLHELRPTTIVETALQELLRQLSEAVTGREGIPVDVQVGCDCKLPPDVHIALYRIAQESLNNIVKHSRANEVAVELKCTKCTSDQDTSISRKIILTIMDDGRGFDREKIKSEGMGLGIMSERAESVNAEIQITSSPGQGTQIKIIWNEMEKDNEG
jgi:signal transduction histidine kinase/ligand-binding sensor domain-containing protein